MQYEKLCRHSRFCSRPRLRRRSGLAMLELAVVMPALLFLTMGLIQFGIFYNATGTLTYLARVGARYAAIQAISTNVVVTDADTKAAVTMTSDAAIRNYIRLKSIGTSIQKEDLPDSAITISPAMGNSNRVSGQPITVTIVYDLRNKAFVGRSFGGVARIGNYTTTMTHVIE
jgi:Flp pilus assembly protein TadG